MFLVILAGSVAIQMRAWRVLSRRVGAGTLSRVGGAARYTVWAFLPVVLMAAAFFTAVGIEEWSGQALVSEAMARSLPSTILFLLVPALAGSVGFTIKCALLRLSTTSR
jgi:hypothetical protein